MKMVLLRYVGVLIVACGILSQVGCAFHVGVDWNGETAKDNRTYTAKQEKK